MMIIVILNNYSTVNLYQIIVNQLKTFFYKDQGKIVP